jgi:hypothetical protein
MRVIIILFFIAFTANMSFAQSADSRLLVKYTSEELTDMKANNPEQYTFVHQCLNHAYYIANSGGKALSKEVRGEVEIANLENINFFALGLEPEENRYLYYKIKGQDKLLVVRSIGHIKIEAAKTK